MQLGAEDRLAAPPRQGQLGRGEHAERWRGEVDQRALRSPAKNADPKVRAGFMLIPESGASTVM